MQTDFLEYLLDVKETKSLSKTADNFYVSYQSVRAGIKNLEQLFSVQLIQCSNKGCILTEAGELIAAYGEQIFQEKKILEEKLKPYILEVPSEKKKKPSLKIFVMSSMANKKILSFLTDYKTSHNKIDMEIKIVKLESLLARDLLEIDNASILLTIYTTMTGAKLYKQFDVLEERYHLGRIEIAKSPLWFVASKKSPWGKFELITGVEMEQIPIFGNDYGEHMCGGTGLEKRNIVNGYAEQAELIKAGLGGGMFSEIEYQAIFANDKSVKKIPINVNGHTTISYIGLTNGEEGFSDELNEFLKAFCAIF